MTGVIVIRECGRFGVREHGTGQARKIDCHRCVMVIEDRVYGRRDLNSGGILGRN